MVAVDIICLETFTYQFLHLLMNPIHKLVVQVLPVLVELFQRADRSSVLRAEAEVLHPVPGWFLCEVVSEVGVVHGHVVVRHVVAIRVRKVEGRLGAGPAEAKSSYLVG